MIEPLNTLIDALREELKQYGEMLALLDQQQEMVAARAADDVLQTVMAIQGQSRVIQRARMERDHLRQQLALALSQTENATFAMIIPLLPEEYRPLVGALVEENNALLARIQQRARQNHMLLSRSVELLQRLISAFLPGWQPKTYNESGHMRVAPVAVHPMYEAVG